MFNRDDQDYFAVGTFLAHYQFGVGDSVCKIRLNDGKVIFTKSKYVALFSKYKRKMPKNKRFA